jgi:Subtilase family
MGQQVVSRNAKRSRAITATGAALLLAGVVAASASASSESDLLYANLPTGGTVPGLSSLPPKDAPGTNAGLSPRLAALAGAVGEESKTAEADSLSLRAHGAGSLERDGNRLIVTARVESASSQLLDNLRAAGAEIVSVNGDYGTVDVSALPSDLIAIAKVPGVKAVTEALAPMVGRVGPIGSATARLPTPAATKRPVCNSPQGNNISEGDTQMQAAAARQQFGVDGSGQTVGILSDSFDVSQSAVTRAATDVSTSDLPGTGNPCGYTTPVKILNEGPATGEDEGRGMAQIVHDIAPGAAIQFSASGATADDMANNVRALKAAGSSVIVDDITYFDEPFFQEGSISTAIDDVTAGGAPYYSSAANSNVIVAGANVGSFETPAFRPSNDCIGLGGTCEDFNAAAGPNPPQNDNSLGFLLNAGSTIQVDLQWAEPRNGVTTDLDVYAYDATLGQLVASGVNNNLQTQQPFELMNVPNQDSSPHVIFIIVYRDVGTPTATPRFKFTMGRPRFSDAEYKTPTGSDIIGPTIFGHNGAPNAVSTAATSYDNAAAPEPYSSRGPITLYLGPVNGTTPAAPLATPQLLNKPDLTGTDGVQTTFFADNSSGLYRFSGTSAAAPHAAAVAALQKSANPGLTVAQVVGAQEATAVPVGSFGHADVGAGLINAAAAVGVNPPSIPDTEITKEPDNKIFGKSVTYKFTSNIPGAKFLCKIDTGKPQACGSPIRVVHIPYGRHKFQVAAVNGNQIDPSPAKDKFKRKHKHGRQL